MKTFIDYTHKECNGRPSWEFGGLEAVSTMLNDLAQQVSDLQEVTRQQHTTYPAIENDRLDSVVTEMNCRCKVCQN